MADALVTLDAGTARALREQSLHRFGRVDCLSEHEAGWLRHQTEAATSLADATLFAEVGTADREISGFATPHALFARTPLKHATRDPVLRSAYLSGLMAFLRERIEAGGYDAIIATSVQDAPGVALAHLAQERGIPFLSPKAIGFGQITSIFDDARNMCPSFRALFAHLAHGELTDGEREILLRGEAALKAFRERPSPPDYMASPVNSPFGMPGLPDTAALLWRMLTRRAPENLRYPYPGSRLFNDWARALKARWLSQNACFKKPEALTGKDFIYFPLHYEPEASLLVSAPHETDQIAVIARIAQAMPEGWRLAVKEHRPMLGRRPVGFYHRLEQMAGVVLLSPFCDGLALARAARLTATITGTAGFEAVLLGRPTLFFADHPIQIIGEGFARAGHPSSLSGDIAAALAAPPARDEVLYAFLGAMLEEGLDFPSSLIWGGLATLGFEKAGHHPEAIERMAELLIGAMKRG